MVRSLAWGSWEVQVVSRWGWKFVTPREPVYVVRLYHIGPLLITQWHH
jgi:hypothetical protein